MENESLRKSHFVYRVDVIARQPNVKYLLCQKRDLLGIVLVGRRVCLENPILAYKFIKKSFEGLIMTLAS